MKIAKKYCHSSFCSFLNALLRRLPESKLTLPEDNLSIYYSYPIFLVDELLHDYGDEQTRVILRAGNQPSQNMARIRPGTDVSFEWGKGMVEMTREGPPFGKIVDAALLPALAKRSDLYIQNKTPALLMTHLSQSLSKAPQKILDLCAAPGGKLLAAHDLFPKAKLWANDLSTEKMGRLAENCSRYNLEAILSQGKAEDYVSDQLFDLIIADVPCSNTGVLNKRAEARWRVSKESLKQLREVQWSILNQAVRLLAPGGCIWYMTCSILRSENEGLIKEACRMLGLTILFQETIVPTLEGLDGGFGCALARV